MPAMRAMPYPCRCLCLGLAQMTITVPCRRMTLQLSQRALTEALTFKGSSMSRCFRRRYLSRYVMRPRVRS